MAAPAPAMDFKPSLASGAIGAALSMTPLVPGSPLKVGAIVALGSLAGPKVGQGLGFIEGKLGIDYTPGAAITAGLGAAAIKLAYDVVAGGKSLGVGAGKDAAMIGVVGAVAHYAGCFALSKMSK